MFRWMAYLYEPLHTYLLLCGKLGDGGKLFVIVCYLGIDHFSARQHLHGVHLCDEFARRSVPHLHFTLYCADFIVVDPWHSVLFSPLSSRSRHLCHFRCTVFLSAYSSSDCRTLLTAASLGCDLGEASTASELIAFALERARCLNLSFHHTFHLTNNVSTPNRDHRSDCRRYRVGCSSCFVALGAHSCTCSYSGGCPHRTYF